VQRAKQLARDADWQHRIRPPIPDTAPKAVVKPIAAGGKVVAGQKSATAQFLRWYCGDAVAVDMEGHGFLHGAYVNVKVEALVVRGISDLLSGKTGTADKRWPPVASRHAAAFAFELLARSTTPPPAGSGGTIPISGAASNDTAGPPTDDGAYDFFVSYVPADRPDEYVICSDEKTSIQARCRCHPTPLCPSSIVLHELLLTTPAIGSRRCIISGSGLQGAHVMPRRTGPTAVNPAGRARQAAAAREMLNIQLR
jgi:hypothetical protein